MKARLLTVAIACGIALVAIAHAQPGEKSGDKKASGPKSPADLAADEFYKAVGEPKGKFDQARFQRVLATGFAFLVQNPNHREAPSVARDLGGFGGRMSDKAAAPLRAAYLAQLKYEIVNQRTKPDVSAESKTTLAAVDAAAADFEAREAFTRENLGTLREKIDVLTPMPGASRHLLIAERSYADLLIRGGRSSAGEAHLKKLLDHPDKDLAAMAREELNLVEVRKEPFTAKFTALDGKECDFAALRGKVVAVVYFRADEASARNFERWKPFHADLRKRGFEMVAVSYDAEADRAKLTKWTQDKKVTWPVYFDGKEAGGDFAPKLNVRTAPAVVLFDAKGMLVATNVPPNNLEPAVRQMLGVKASEPEPEEMPAMGGGKGGRRR